MQKHKDFSSFYSDVSGGEGKRCNYTTRLDTYGCGCAHDCAYCYARSLLDFRGLWHPDKPAVASVDYIRKKVDKVKPGTVLRLGGMTDCFQPAEETYRATYQTIRLLNSRNIGYLIVTKSSLVADPVYLRLLDPQLAHVQVSVTSTSDESNFLDEKASKPSERIEAAEKLQDAGIDVQLRVSPYLPELVDVEAINRAKVDKCLVEFLRVNHWIEKWTGKNWSSHTVKAGGYRHLPLDAKIGLLNPFRKQMTVCEDVPEHYEYFKTNYNHNPNDCCDLRGSE